MQGDVPRDVRDPGSGSCSSIANAEKWKASARCARSELRAFFFLVPPSCPVMSAIWTRSPQLEQVCPPTEVGGWAIMLIAEKRGLCRSVGFDEKGGRDEGLPSCISPFTSSLKHYAHN